MKSIETARDIHLVRNDRGGNADVHYVRMSPAADNYEDYVVLHEAARDPKAPNIAFPFTRSFEEDGRQGFSQVILINYEVEEVRDAGWRAAAAMCERYVAVTLHETIGAVEPIAV